MSAKNRLGKGLEALIPTFEQAAPESIEEAHELHVGVSELPIDAIKPNPHQPRTHFKEEDLVELAHSIKQHGVLQPVVVISKGSHYELVVGERRLRASKLAGLTHVPAVVREIDEQMKLELAIVENIQRTDLSPMELAEAYRRMMDDFGLKQEQVADKMGKARPTVANTLRLLNLPSPIKRALMEGIITEGHARAILSVPTQEQVDFYEVIIGEQLTVREAEERSRRFARSRTGSAGKATKSIKDVSADEKKLLSDLRNSLGAKVTLERRAKGGVIKIEYYSAEELERIIAKIK